MPAGRMAWQWGIRSY